MRPLLPFLGRERRVSDVAVELGLKVDAMYYRVRRLEALGLLEVARTVPRKGRALRLYRARSTHFFVPFTALAERTVEELLAEGDAEMRRRAARSTAAAMRDARLPLRMGIHVHLDAAGAPSVALGPADRDWSPQRLLAPGVPAIASAWAPLRLDFEDAKALQRELFELIGRYAAKRGAQPYLLGVQLAPTPEG